MTARELRNATHIRACIKIRAKVLAGMSRHAFAQWHADRETTKLRDLCSALPSDAERHVIDMAREYYRTDGDTHNELMDAVQQLERAYLNAASQPAVCFCGTGREHERGSGYHCRAEHQARLAEETS